VYVSGRQDDTTRAQSAPAVNREFAEPYGPPSNGPSLYPGRSDAPPYADVPPPPGYTPPAYPPPQAYSASPGYSAPSPSQPPSNAPPYNAPQPYDSPPPFNAAPPYNAPRPYNTPAPYHLPPPRPDQRSYVSPYGYATASQHTNGYSVASLVLGILWLFGIGSVLALVFGYIAKAQINRSYGAQGGRGIAMAGTVLGWIGVAAVLVLGSLLVATLAGVVDVHATTALVVI
jgi:hypothetical protein